MRDNGLPDKQEAFQERAAIMEYEGGLTRKMAEIEATRIVYGDDATGAKK